MSVWAGRIVGGLSSLGLMACAAIAGLRDPVESDSLPNEQGSEEAGDSSSSSSSSGGAEGGDSDDDARADAPVDAPAPACVLKQNGIACKAGGECCSERCNEAAICAQQCRSVPEGCNALEDAPCCLGSYCAGLFCALCIGPGGNAAPALGGGSNVKSCCSRELDEMGKKCK